MGFSISAVVVIFTASVIYMTTIYYPLMDMSYHNYLSAEQKANEMQYEKLNTKIAISSWEDNNITIYNNGSTALNASKLNVILNGTLDSSPLSIYPEGVWPPRTFINVTIGASSGRVKVIAANGASDYYMVT